MVEPVGIISVVLSSVLIALWLAMAICAAKHHMPVPMLAGIVAAGLMAVTLLITGLGLVGFTSDYLGIITATLRFSSGILLIAALWAMRDFMHQREE